MNLGNNLYHARKKKGLSQEDVAEKIGVSRQTISKRETDETLPDIRQAKQLAILYGLALDELIEFDVDLQEIQETIERMRDEVTNKIDWTKAWSKKYPILESYQKEVNITYYAEALCKLLITWKRNTDMTNSIPCWCLKIFWRQCGRNEVKRNLKTDMRI